MKIAIGTNIFGEYSRQTLAIESLKTLKEKAKLLNVEIDLFNLQFEENTSLIDGFITLHCLKNSNLTIRDEIVKASGYNTGCVDCDGTNILIPYSPKRLPLMNELFGALGDLIGYDYVIFTNSDIMISNRLISEILESKKESYCVSRLDIREINTITDPIIPFKIEIAGFDTYVFKSSWWQENKLRFPKYLLGKPRWDNHYTSIFMTHSDGKILNYYPGHIIHIFHGYGSHQDDMENRYVNKLWDLHPGLQSGWGTYFDEILNKRSHYNSVALANKNNFEDNLSTQIFNISKQLDNGEINGFTPILNTPDNLKMHDKMKLYIKEHISY